MSRRVPEFALVAGLLFGGSVLLAGLLFTDDPPLTMLLAGAVSYPLVAYAVAVTDDPTAVLPPRAVAAVGAGLGATAAGVIVVAGEAPLATRPFRALLAGLGFALPAAAYRVRYGPPAAADPRRVAVATVAAGSGLVLAGALAGAALPAAAAGGLLALSGAGYALSRGHRLAHRARRRGLAAGVVVAASLLGVGLAAAVPVGRLLPAAAVATLVPAVYHAAASESVA